MNVLVTGATGHIGHWACQKLIASGHTVRAFDKCIYAGFDSLREFCGDLECVEGDIRWVGPELCDGVDAIIHLAGFSNDGSAKLDPAANDDINVAGTARLARAAIECGVRRFTFASSCSVYGCSQTPDLSESAPVSPLSEYAHSKVAAEKVLLEAGAAGALEPVVLRQATVMGWSPRMRWDLVVNAMTRSALVWKRIDVHAGGEAWRPLVEVRDVAEAHVRCVAAPSEAVSGQVFNLAHRRDTSQAKEGYTIACLALWVKELLHERGHECEVRGHWGVSEPRSYDVTSARFREALRWEPGIGVAGAVEAILNGIGDAEAYNWTDPRTENVKWMEALGEGELLVARSGGVLSRAKREELLARRTEPLCGREDGRGTRRRPLSAVPE
jgi:nucleoside-diphosphate-sugar epimerase